MDDTSLHLLLQRQDQVIARFQVLALGGDDTGIERKLRRREWARIHPGVYVTHTGPPTWHQRAWAAVLCCWPAALDGPSALRAFAVRTGSGRDGDPVHVAVDWRRRVDPPRGVVVRRIREFERVLVRGLLPPRTTLEHAVLRTAGREQRPDTVVAVLADACQAHRTTARRLRAELDLLPRLPGRWFLAEVLGDVAAGALSPLERRYLRDVERAHGLPRGTRQVRLERTCQDIRYAAQRLVVELDGRLGHEWATDRWKDLDRDLVNLRHDLVTIHLGWHQAVQPCRTAAAVAAVLAARGWAGTARRCGPGCRLPR